MVVMAKFATEQAFLICIHCSRSLQEETNPADISNPNINF